MIVAILASTLDISQKFMLVLRVSLTKLLQTNLIPVAMPTLPALRGQNLRLHQAVLHRARALGL